MDDLAPLTALALVCTLSIRAQLVDAVALEDVDPPVPFMSREIIRVTPTWITSWGVDPDAPGRQTRRS